jgi:hypothetical protein
VNAPADLTSRAAFDAHFGRAPFGHDLDSEVIEWRQQRDRAVRAMDDATAALVNELARSVTARELERLADARP